MAFNTPKDIQALIALETPLWGDRLASIVASGVPVNAFDNVISRSDVAALIPEDVSGAILTKVTEEAASSRLFRSARMSREQQRMPVLAALPVSYFVNGDTGMKQTTEVDWANKYLDAEEIACIVPIPEAVLDDVSYDVWGAIRPLIEESVGRTLDAAIFFGANKPSIWPKCIADIAIGAGSVYQRGTNAAIAGGIAQDINGLFSLVETSGFDVNGIIAHRLYKGVLRGARDGEGRLLQEVTPTSIYSETVQYPMRGLWPTGVSAVDMIAGDFSQGILAVRQDVTYKILSEAVIQDNTGKIIYNLATQDMVAMRVVSRWGYQVSNVVNFDQPVEALRSPWAVMANPTS